jgi:hypothetical protein|tara:strand:+ start:397 stop:774 length:378 start_codon:yes stop_codon:yes gene_type:complete
MEQRIENSKKIWLTYLEENKIHHDDLERFATYLAITGQVCEPAVAQIMSDLINTEEEHFLGQYASTAEFAEEMMSNGYLEELDALPDELRYAIDWAQVWHDYLRHDCLDYETDDPDYRWFIWHLH